LENKVFFAKEINMMSITYWADKDIIFSFQKIIKYKQPYI